MRCELCGKKLSRKDVLRLKRHTRRPVELETATTKLEPGAKKVHGKPSTSQFLRVEE